MDVLYKVKFNGLNHHRQLAVTHTLASLSHYFQGAVGASRETGATYVKKDNRNY